ncbi:MAG: ATPase [Bacteroidales bacterium]|nr:ATPase [Bacteroidales bacterium]
MKIIVESGATKTDWRLITDDGQVRSASGLGLNPSVLDSGQIGRIIGAVIPQLNPDGKSVDDIFFYGAGLVSDTAAAPLAEAFGMWCPFARVEFHTDMLAAARALFGDGSGVVAIMGTGSNSCLYENGSVVRNIRPGGFILGDEGSGAALGKAFLSDYIKGLVPESLEKEFEEEFKLDYQNIVRKVYREPAPSAFLASFAPFLIAHDDDVYVDSLLEECVEAFVARSLSRYGKCSRAGVVGSFGYACAEYLRRAGARHGLEFTDFLKSPIEKLVEYHTK